MCQITGSPPGTPSMPTATQAHSGPPLSHYICYFRQTENRNPHIDAEGLGIRESCVVCEQGERHWEEASCLGWRWPTCHYPWPCGHSSGCGHPQVKNPCSFLPHLSSFIPSLTYSGIFLDGVICARHGSYCFRPQKQKTLFLEEPTF